MLLQIFIRCLVHLPKKRLPIVYNRQIHVISDVTSSSVSSSLKKYFPNIVFGKTLKDFSFIDLFLGKYRFAGRPNKQNLSFSEKLKRVIIRCFFTDYERVAATWNFIDQIFLSSSKRCLFIRGKHIRMLFQTHFPSFSIQKLSDSWKPLHNNVISVLFRVFYRIFPDYSSGVTVFFNVNEDVFLFLKAYKLLRPNKTVYLRFHDMLETFVKKENIPVFRRKLHELLDKKIINGVSSYCESDARLLGIEYCPNAVHGDVMKERDYPFRTYLYTFIGAEMDNDDLSHLSRPPLTHIGWMG